MEFVEFSRKITPMKMIWRGDSIGELKHGEVFGEIIKVVDEFSTNQKKPGMRKLILFFPTRLNTRR